MQTEPRLRSDHRQVSELMGTASLNINPGRHNSGRCVSPHEHQRSHTAQHVQTRAGPSSSLPRCRKQRSVRMLAAACKGPGPGQPSRRTLTFPPLQASKGHQPTASPALVFPHSLVTHSCSSGPLGVPDTQAGARAPCAHRASRSASVTAHPQQEPRKCQQSCGCSRGEGARGPGQGHSGVRGVASAGHTGSRAVTEPQG